ncbi:MAG: hypothetical protein IPM51_15230 [Sphingobacteriaceae bacterium]|nr:hypothetical protein [Sphingobacteriaceae bacterium]
MMPTKTHPFTANKYYAPNQQMPTSYNSINGNTSILLSQFELIFNKNNKVYHVINNSENIIFGNGNLASNYYW